jgi:hypothetical protein
MKSYVAILALALILGGCKEEGPEPVRGTSEGSVTIETPTPEPKAEKAPAKTTGLPDYPGSEDTGDSMTYEEDGKTVVLSVRTTRDKAAKVAAFYKAKLTEPKASTTGPITTLDGKLPDGRSVSITILQDEKHTRVSIATR